MTLATSCEATGLNPMSFSDQHGTVVLERLRYQRETGRFCDVAILVKDRQFAAHRNILASCSPYFDSIFKATKVTKEQVMVNCPSPPAFELLLNYMYSGCVVIDRSCVSELLRLANNFLVTKLKNYCAEYLDRYLDAANCLSVKVLASKFNLPSVLKAASDYFDVNINRCLLESVDILQYPIQQLNKVITDPKYQDVISPDVHLKLISRWVGENLDSREASFRLLLSSCPVAQVSDSTLEFLLDYSPLFSKSQSSRFLLLHTMQENGISLDKYQPQLSSLSQQIGGEQLMEQTHYLEDDENDSGGEGMEDEEYDESPVDGQPSTSQVLETTYDEDGVEKPRLKLKINLGGAAVGERRRSAKHSDKNKLYRKAIGNMAKRRGRPPKERVENEILPMVDDDDIDGVYATSSLEGAVVSYTDEDFLDPEDVEEGEENSIENGPYRCGFCRFACLLDEDLEKHRARAHNRNTLYMCQLCDFEANWSKQFYEHCRQHHWRQAPYHCDQCDFVATEMIQDLLAHRLTHTEERFFKCLDCGFRARTRTQLWAHERMHSTLDERPMHCEECGRGFNQEAALQMHQASHDEQRALICEDCGFATNNSDHLTVHRRQHTGDVFYCHIEGCDYVSPKKSQLAAHLRTHMAVRSHMCKMCGRGFIEKSHLVRHERIHLEDKPFKCDMCEYASSRRDKLKEHILKHHNGNSAGSKSHRRRYRRARQLAVLTAQAKLAPPDTMFRPIPQSETVSQWAETQATYQQPYADMSLQQQHQDQQQGAGPIVGAPYSPQRAFSVTHPAARQLASLSPGSMSLINVHLGGPDQLLVDKPTLGETITTPQLITPEPRSPTHSHQDLFLSNSGPGTDNLNRPMSLPPYSQQQQQQSSTAQPTQSQQTMQWW